MAVCWAFWVGGAMKHTHQPPGQRESTNKGLTSIFDLTLRPLHMLDAGPLNRTPTRGQRVRSTGCPFERTHFHCRGLITRLAASLRSWRRIHLTSSGTRRRCDSSEAGCE
jgi:hypothetical protein